MINGGGTFSIAAKNGAKNANIRVLAACVAGADELIRAFQTALQAVPNLEVLRENLPAMDSHNLPEMLRGLLARTQPALLTLCLPAGKTEGVEALFETVQKCQLEIS